MTGVWLIGMEWQILVTVCLRTNLACLSLSSKNRMTGRKSLTDMTGAEVSRQKYERNYVCMMSTRQALLYDW